MSINHRAEFERAVDGADRIVQELMLARELGGDFADLRLVEWLEQSLRVYEGRIARWRVVLLGTDPAYIAKFDREQARLDDLAGDQALQADMAEMGL